MRRVYLGLSLLCMALLALAAWSGRAPLALSAPFQQVATPSRTPYVEATVTPIPTWANVTPGPSPTTSVALVPSIVGIFPCQGVPCMNWNLRSGCGENDLWIDIAAGALYTTLAGYKLEVRDTSNVDVCSRIFAADSRIVGVKTTFLDEMETWTHAPCLAWPTSGFVYLYNASGIMIDSISYVATG